MSDVSLIEVNSEETISEIITAFEQATGETLYPGDERRIFLMQLAPVLLGIKNNINYAARQNLLRYASGEMLDAIGELYGTSRLPAQKAQVTVEFSLSAAQVNTITIPAGTRVTADGMVYFALLQALSIPAGQTKGSSLAEATEAGNEGNSYVSGQIKLLVDPVPYVAGVVNINSSSGGSDVESDDNFRERIRQAPESFSVAGSSEAYAYWAKTADVNIADISVSSPSPGVVNVVPLMEGGEMPTQGILDKVSAIVSARDKRPLTDQVQVFAPEPVPYNVLLTYFIHNSRQTDEVNIREAIEGSGGAVEQFTLWQKGKLGRAINPDELRYKLMSSGAFRIIINEPSYGSIPVNKVAVANQITVNYGGIES